MIVKLTAHNMFMAGMVGVSRHVKGMNKQGQYGANNNKNGWQYNCDGACGEMCVAKYLNKYWDGALGNFRAQDVGHYQVRTTPNDWGHLLLHPKDEDAEVFILILSHGSPEFILKGWLLGKEGKVDEFWRDGTKGRPAFFVPQEALHSMDTLPPVGVK